MHDLARAVRLTARLEALPRDIRDRAQDLMRTTTLDPYEAIQRAEAEAVGLPGVVQQAGTLPPAPRPRPLADDELRAISGTADPKLQRDIKGKVCNHFCPVCERAMHANKRGEWRCYGCGASGGTFKGKRLFLRTVPATDAGRAAAERLAAQW